MRGVDAHLVIAGHAAGSAPREQGVTFTGWVDDADLEGLYALADGAVYPSLFEGFGMPALEAMARGVPLACSNASSLPEVTGDAAELFDPHDVAAMRAAVGGCSDERRRGARREAAASACGASPGSAAPTGVWAIYEKAARSPASTCAAARAHVRSRHQLQPGRRSPRALRVVASRPRPRRRARAGRTSASVIGPSSPNVATIASLATSTTGSPQASISVGTSDGLVSDSTTPTVAARVERARGRRASSDAELRCGKSRRERPRLAEQRDLDARPAPVQLRQREQPERHRAPRR